MVPRGTGDNCDNPIPPRVVLHVDLDAFFVQVERSLNPTLIGQPMAVQQHADIIAVSYEARELGVTKHMPTRTIRQRFPSVKLVHVQTMGLQNDKVSYRNYHKAARSIFTLIKAFCPSEGDDKNGNQDYGASNDREAFSGKFQKTSVDEAYLEPGWRTLEAELARSQQHRQEARLPADGSTKSIEGVKRPRSDILEGSRECGPSLPEVNRGARRSSEDSICDESMLSGSQGATYREAKVSVDWRGGVCSEPMTKDEGENRRRSTKIKKKERMEVDRLLEAGGSLGIRIQRALRDALEYDCSVGVAENKFLAKLATSTAKPKGVRVLFRRDVASILASTPPTKIPGCGTGTPAARQFTKWGANSVSDLRRFDAMQLRERLGDQLGAKVYHRCRGIDNDPVEPNPEPSRISSSMSLVPLIKPAYCLGKPKEKLTPIFPWELERLRSCMATLVDDLLDRMEEEVQERKRRPTKVCVEYHLHKRGSKSQTFPLPPSAPRPHKAPVGDALSVPPVDASPDTILVAELPPSSALVDLSLAPFKSFKRKGAGTDVVKDTSRNCDTPPVVKLIITLFGFQSLEKLMHTAASSKQRTLRDMVWLGNESGASEEVTPQHGLAGTTEAGIPTSSSSAESTTVSQAHVDSALSRPDVGRQTRSSPPSPRLRLAAERLSPSRRERNEQQYVQHAVQGDVLVRCPRCKICLPLGQSWDRHREQHLVLERRRTFTSGTVTSLESSSVMTRRDHAVPRQQGVLSMAVAESQKGRQSPSVRPELAREGTVLAKREQAPHGASVQQEQQGASALSALLPLVVEASQAREFLNERGLLHGNAQTRFAHLFVNDELDEDPDD